MAGTAEKMGFEKNRRFTVDWHNKPEVKYGCKFKSQAERKWADYLQAILELGAIVDWKYEPKRFDCGMSYNKHRFYTPDFLVREIQNRYEYEVYHEVKVRLTQKDVSRFRWLKKAHPNILIILVLPYCSRNANQARLRMNAHKYVERIVYANPLYKEFGIK